MLRDERMVSRRSKRFYHFENYEGVGCHDIRDKKLLLQVREGSRENGVSTGVTDMSCLTGSSSGLCGDSVLCQSYIREVNTLQLSNS